MILYSWQGGLGPWAGSAFSWACWTAVQRWTRSKLLLVVAVIVRGGRLQLSVFWRRLLLNVLVRGHGDVLVLHGGLFVVVGLLVLQLFQLLFLLERVLLVFERELERVGRLLGGLRLSRDRGRLHVLVRGRRRQILESHGGRLRLLRFRLTSGQGDDGRRRWNRYVLVRCLRLRQIFVLRNRTNEIQKYYYDCRVRLICDLARFPAGLAVQFPVRYLRCANNYYCLFINTWTGNILHIYGCLKRTK